MKVLVFEAATAGALAEAKGESPSPDVLSEGYAMLRSFLRDLKAAGHTTLTVLDKGLLDLSRSLEADEKVAFSPGSSARRLLKGLSRGCDAVHVIAPEAHGLLAELIEAVEETVGKGASLNASPEAVSMAADKAIVYETLRKAGIGVPETLLLKNARDLQLRWKDLLKLGFPLVFKPVEGVGCSGLSVVRGPEDVKAALARFGALRASERGLLVQRLVRGVPASVSLLCDGRRCRSLSLNRQIVHIRPPEVGSAYKGGIVPLDHSLRDEAFRAAEEAALRFGGLRGYVGIDLILTGSGAIVVDLNPRLTTSYVGLRMVALFNVAQAIVEAIMKGKLIEGPQTSGYALFMKVPLKDGSPLKAGLEGMIIAPPFPLKGCQKPMALLAVRSENLQEAARAFRTAMVELRLKD